MSGIVRRRILVAIETCSLLATACVGEAPTGSCVLGDRGAALRQPITAG